MRPEAAEQRRQQGNLIRLGTVAELDLGVARCRIRTGEITTDWIPWLVPRAGSTMEWSAPSIGEQGLVVCQDGDTAAAVFLRGLYSDALPAPASAAGMHLIRFHDGTQIQYDASAHALTAALCEGGTATLTADSGVTVNAGGGVTINASSGTTINGDVQVNGKLVASDDVLAAGISLKSHVHPGVESGTSSTGAPQ